jgi:hypothetical protein
MCPVQVIQPTPAFQPVIFAPPPVAPIMPTPVVPGAAPAIQPAIQPVPAPGMPPQQAVTPIAMPGPSMIAPAAATPFPGYPSSGAVLPAPGSTSGSTGGAAGGTSGGQAAAGGSSAWSPVAAVGPPALASNSSEGATSDGGSSASTPVPAKYVPPVVPTAAPQPLLVSIDSVGGYQVGACVMSVSTCCLMYQHGQGEHVLWEGLVPRLMYGKAHLCVARLVKALTRRV